MSKALRAFAMVIGMTTMVAAATLAATSANAATLPTHATTAAVQMTSASAATAAITADHPSDTMMLSASRSAKTVTVEVQSAQAAPLIMTVPTTVVPAGINCYFPTCGWEFSHAQTVGLWTGGFAVALAACHRYLGPVGLTYVCDAVAGWLSVHLAPKDNQCLYVSTLPVGVIKYVTC